MAVTEVRGGQPRGARTLASKASALLPCGLRTSLEGPSAPWCRHPEQDGLRPPSRPVC